MVDFSISVSESRAQAIRDSWPADEKPTIRAIQDQYKVLKKEAATKGIKAARGSSSGRINYSRSLATDSSTAKQPSTPVKKPPADVKTPTSSAKKRRRCESDSEEEEVQLSSSPSAVSDEDDESNEDAEVSGLASITQKQIRKLPTRSTRSIGTVYADSEDFAAAARNFSGDEDSDSDFMTESMKARKKQQWGNHMDQDVEQRFRDSSASSARERARRHKASGAQSLHHQKIQTEGDSADEAASATTRDPGSRRTSWQTAIEGWDDEVAI